MTSAHTKSILQGVTAYLIFLITAVSLGPLPFGFHLVSPSNNPYSLVSTKCSKAELNAPQGAMTCKNQQQNTSITLPIVPSECIQMSRLEFAFGILNIHAQRTHRRSVCWTSLD